MLVSFAVLSSETVTSTAEMTSPFESSRSKSCVRGGCGGIRFMRVPKTVSIRHDAANRRKPSVERIFRALRVYSGSAVVWKDPGYIWNDLTGGGGRVTANKVVEAALREAPNNLKKLAAANTNRRHLVVYLDPTNYLPWKSLVDCDPHRDHPIYLLRSPTYVCSPRPVPRTSTLAG
jgi:hypothetical protein